MLERKEEREGGREGRRKKKGKKEEEKRKRNERGAVQRKGETEPLIQACKMTFLIRI